MPLRLLYQLSKLSPINLTVLPSQVSSQTTVHVSSPLIANSCNSINSNNSSNRYVRLGLSRIATALGRPKKQETLEHSEDVRKITLGLGEITSKASRPNKDK